MATHSEAVEQEQLVPLGILNAVIQEARRGLAKQPRSLAPWMFYDRRGSYLFDRITTLPEYYPTRTERGIMARNADAILDAVLDGTSQPLRIVELGAGMASKTGILLDAAACSHGTVSYIPLDVSRHALEHTRLTVEHTHPRVRVEPRFVNYVDDPPQLEAFHGRTLVLYLGSSIGNFSPRQARNILRNAFCQMRKEDAFVLGADLVKDESTLLAAYNDRAGVTAAFNLNVLHRLNREAGADFDSGAFRHRACWNARESRIEMHLDSLRRQRVSVAAAGLDIQLEEGESIHTENSYKFTDESLTALFRDSGAAIESTWQDERRQFAVILARPGAATADDRLTMDVMTSARNDGAPFRGGK